MLPIFSASRGGSGGISADDIRALISKKVEPCLRIHFLNVGHGDCTVIQHPSGRVTVVDINNGKTIDESSCKEIINSMPPPLCALDISTLLPEENVFLELSKTPEQRQKERLEKAGYSYTLTNPIEFLKNSRISSVFRYIQTHPDLDHMRGLAALKQEIEIVNFWDTFHNKKTPIARS